MLGWVFEAVTPQATAMFKFISQIWRASSHKQPRLSKLIFLVFGKKSSHSSVYKGDISRHWNYVFWRITVIGNWTHAINQIFISVKREMNQKSVLCIYDVYWATANKLAVFWSCVHHTPLEGLEQIVRCNSWYSTYLALPLLRSSMLRETCCVTPMPSHWSQYLLIWQL